MSDVVRFVVAPDLPPEWQIAWWLVLAVVLLVVALNVVYVLPELVRYVHEALTKSDVDPEAVERARLTLAVRLTERKQGDPL